MQVEFRKSNSTSPRAPLGEAKVNFGPVSVKCVVWQNDRGPWVKWPSIKLDKPWTDRNGKEHQYDDLVYFTSKEDREAATNAVLAAVNYAPSHAPARSSAPPPEDDADRLPF
jgi:hypothetical protein